MNPQHTIAIVIATASMLLLCIIGPCLDSNDITHTLTVQEKTNLILRVTQHPNDFKVYSTLLDEHGRMDIVAEDDKLKIVYRRDKGGKFLTVLRREPPKKP